MRRNLLHADGGVTKKVCVKVVRCAVFRYSDEREVRQSKQQGKKMQGVNERRPLDLPREELELPTTQ